MAKFGGYGGGFGGGNQMQNLMRQAQKMQEQMQKAQEELENAEIEGVAGGEMVKVVMNGKKSVLSVSINPSVVDPDDVEMLEDLILVAIKDAEEKAEKLSEEKMGPLSGMGGF